MQMSSMRFLVAMDSLKGCLSSREANRAAREALLRWSGVEVISLTVSDGGEGFLEAVEDAAPDRTWQHIEADVLDPLLRPIRARYLMSGDHAFIEMAQASGLCLLSADELNPLQTNSYGTGQLIADALHRGARQVTLGLGGSATSDCGRGLLQALEGTAPQGVRFTLATDVRNPLLGPQGAARVFAPQKGATPAMVDELERRAIAFARDNALRMGRDCASQPGAGAAGGAAYALMQYFGAYALSGADLLLRMAHADTLLSQVSLVITGEGHADRQTLMGKFPSVLLRRAQAFGVPVWLVAGRVSDAKKLEDAGFSRVLQMTSEAMSLSEAMRPSVARRNLVCALTFPESGSPEPSRPQS